MTRLPSLCALFALLAAIAGAAHAACRVEPLGTVPLQVSSGHILIAVAVNDIEAAFIMDTGAERTLMSEEAVRRLGLQRDGWVASAILGLGGGTQHPNALPRSLQLGGLALRRKTLTGDTSVTVGPLPVREVEGRPIAGLLGRDFLSPFDLDLDLPARRMTLNDVRGCGTWFLPWTVRVVPIVDMLLGVDWLQSRRVWLSFATRQVFVTVPQ